MNRSEYFLLIPIAILLIITGFLVIQNMGLNEQIQITNDNNQRLQATLNNYTTTFGDTSFNQNLPKSPWKIETKAFVASSLDELTPITAVKIGEQYSVTAMVTRPAGVADYPPLLGYVMYVQVLDQNGDRIAGSWHQDTIRVGQTISAGTYWSPTTIGDYTVKVFVWQSFTGTPHAEPVRFDVNVTK